MPDPNNYPIKAQYNTPTSALLALIKYSEDNPQEDVRKHIVIEVDKAIKLIENLPASFADKEFCIKDLELSRKSLSWFEVKGKDGKTEVKTFFDPEEMRDLLLSIKTPLQTLDRGLEKGIHNIKLSGDSDHDIQAIITAMQAGSPEKSRALDLITEPRSGEKGEKYSFCRMRLLKYGINASYIGLYNEQHPQVSKEVVSPHPAFEAARQAVAGMDKGTSGVVETGSNSPTVPHAKGENQQNTKDTKEPKKKMAVMQ